MNNEYDDLEVTHIELKKSYGMPNEFQWKKAEAGMLTSEMDPEVLKLLEEKIKNAEKALCKNYWALSQPNWVEHFIPPLTRWQRFKQRVRDILRLRRVKVHEEYL